MVVVWLVWPHSAAEEEETWAAELLSARTCGATRTDIIWPCIRHRLTNNGRASCPTKPKSSTSHKDSLRAAPCLLEDLLLTRMLVSFSLGDVMDHIDSVLASLDLFSDLAENLVSSQPPLFLG